MDYVASLENINKAQRYLGGSFVFADAAAGRRAEAGKWEDIVGSGDWKTLFQSISLQTF